MFRGENVVEVNPEVWGGKLHYLWVGVGTFSILFVVNLLIFKSRLILEIKDGQIAYQFLPFHFSLRKIQINKITEWDVRKVNPILESSGFGYKRGIDKISMIMKGNWVLIIKREKGPKLLLGTQKPEELRKEMKKLMNPEGEF